MNGYGSGTFDRFAGGFVSLIVVASLLATGCEATDRTRANLKAQQEQWESRLTQQREIHANTETRFRAFPLRGDGERDAAFIRHRQVDALVSANRQTLTDFEIQIQQATSEVEAGIKEGGPAGPAALDLVSERMATYLYRQDESLTAATIALARLEQGTDIGNAQ